MFARRIVPILAATILSARVVLAAEEPVPGAGGAYWIWAVVLAVAMLLLLWYLSIKGDDDVMKPLDRFIARHLERGFTAEQIQDALLRRGWPQQLIERGFAVQEMAVTPAKAEPKHMEDPYNPLREYIRYKSHQGESALLIRDRLLKVGWKDEILDPIIIEILREIRRERGALRERHRTKAP